MADRSRGRSGRADAPPPVKTSSDAYVGLLVLSLLLQMVAGGFLLADYMEYKDKPPTPPSPMAVGGPGTSAPAPAPGGPAPGVAPAPAPGAPLPGAAAPGKG